MKLKSLVSLTLLCSLFAACKGGDESEPLTCSLSDNNSYYYNYGGYIYVPNAFTPNGDGRNDVYRPVFARTGTGYFGNYRLEIRDKQGNVVYVSADTADAGWDGRNTNGVKLSPGRYIANLSYSTGYGGQTTYDVCVSLLSYNGASCIPASADGAYVFGDQYDPSTGYPGFNTGERICY